MPFKGFFRIFWMLSNFLHLPSKKHKIGNSRIRVTFNLIQSDDPRLATRRYLTVWIKLLLWWYISFQTFALSILRVPRGVVEKSGRLRNILGHTPAKTCPIPTGHPINLVAMTPVLTSVILADGTTLCVMILSNSSVKSHCKYLKQ